MYYSSRSATVIADASYCYQSGCGGYAYWVSVIGRRIKGSGRFKTKPLNHNDAEYKALMNGLHVATRDRNIKKVLLQTDSMATVHQINKNLGFIKQFRQNRPDVYITARHVKGHVKQSDKRYKEPRYYVNSWCDKKAKEQMRKWRNEP